MLLLLVCFLVVCNAGHLSEVAYNLQVDKTLKWTPTFSHRIQNTENSLLAEFCLKLENFEDVVALLEKIDGGNICVGNPDEQFVSLTEKDGGSLLNHSG